MSDVEGDLPPVLFSDATDAPPPGHETRALGSRAVVEAEARGALRRLGAWLQQRERQVAEAHARRALTADEVPFSPSRPHPWPPPTVCSAGGGDIDPISRCQTV